MGIWDSVILEFLLRDIQPCPLTCNVPYWHYSLKLRLLYWLQYLRGHTHGFLDLQRVAGMSPNSYPVDQAGSTFPGLRPLTSDNPSGLDDRQWNALVGIVTAIVGNILISFALNLQRYAHIRINRENATWEMRGKGTTSSQYGTQARIAEERSRTNLKTPMAGRRSLLLGNEYDESTPLRHELRQTDDLESAAESEDGDNEAEQQQQSTNYLKSPWWWAGITLMTTGEAGNFLA